MIASLLLPLALLATGAFPSEEEVCSFEEAHLVTLPDGFVVYGDVAWSPNGKRAAYIAYKDAETFAAIGEEIYDSFQFLGEPTFSSDSEHVVFRAGERTSKTKEVWWPFLDGKKGKKQDWIGLVYFRPGTDELIYWTQPGAKIQKDGAYNRGKQVLLSGKKKGKKWEDAGSLFPMDFSDDGKVAATSVMKGSLWYVLLAGKKKQEVSKRGSMMMTSVALSPDGKRWAADVKDMNSPAPGGGPPVPGEKVYVPRLLNHISLSDGEIATSYDQSGAPVFSPDSSQIAFKYWVEGEREEPGKMGVALESGAECKAEFAYVFKPVFHPSGKSFAYAGNIGGKLDSNILWYPSAGDLIDGGETFVVQANEDGTEISRSEAFEKVANLTYSKSGDELAFMAKTKEGWVVHWAGQTSEPYEQIGPLHFDQDGARLAFGTRTLQSIDWRVLERASD